LEKTIRVLIADDSAFMRKVLASMINADPQLEVIGEARDGREAVQQAEALAPDVISMDINMPHMDGLQATEAIMARNPRPIVIVSSESREGAEPTLRSLELGAIDFVPTPSSGVDLDMNSVREEITRKLKMAARVRVVRTATRSRLQNEVAASAPRVEPADPMRSAFEGSARPAGKFPVVVLAASTGGPATLMRFAPQFPRDFPGAVILVQHMPAGFTGQFAEQLRQVSPIAVKEAEAGEIIQPGRLYVCPGSHHLRLTETGRITLDDGPRVNGYKPCADLALESAAAFAGPMAIGVVMTGMGNDACAGVKQIKAAGGYVLAQDESTCVIFGMGAEAVRTGAVDQVLPIDSLYRAIEKRVLYVYGAARVGAL
jgi:two-component system chemotaxis response regulator CheB